MNYNENKIDEAKRQKINNKKELDFNQVKMRSIQKNENNLNDQ